MKPVPFQMSSATKEHLAAGLHGLDHTTQSQILHAVAMLCAEVEMHVREKAFEDLRQEWASTLAVMIRHG